MSTPPEPGRLTLHRRAFLIGGLSATAATAALAAPSALAAGTNRACCPTRIAAPIEPAQVSLRDTAIGNQQAMAMARRSSTIMRLNELALQFAADLPDDQVRQATLDLLRNPAPSYQLRSPSPTDKAAVRAELLEAGLIPDRTNVEGIFPPVADPSQAPQAFWSAPGSTYTGHHAFPGGLLVHEWFNAQMARQFATTYDEVYGLASGPGAIDVSIAYAAPLWHDIHKVTVNQWNPDGSEFIEQVIADTGGHHPLSGAEAIVRGMSPDFVIALLSAHDAPTNINSNPTQTGLQRLVNYIRAAAIIARVDPVETGLLVSTPDGGFGLVQNPPRVEGHIDHLSDHDFVFSIDSAVLLVQTLKQLAPTYGIDPAAEPARFNLFRNTVLSQVPDMRLYGFLQVGGADAVKSAIDREVDFAGVLDRK